ncbi:MAG: T9SS type A sorting domain-containing protein [Opitutaceae bacterium]|nr:T9SS type A sorting domain-containing protein [Cytophagales bacterium]
MLTFYHNSKFYLSLILGFIFQISLVFGQNPCSNYPMVGFATVNAEGISTTTGGAGGTTVTVTNINQLQAWSLTRENNTSAQILYISGKISTADVASSLITIKNGANISIIGINGGELQGVGLNIRDYNNVIVRNLKIHEVVYPNDGLTLDNVNHSWVDHNEFYSINGPGIGVDTYDGLFDIKKGSRYVTVSWNVFHDHKKVLLIGHTDNVSAQAEDSQFKITIHHNYFYNNDGRNPSLRFGLVHMYNNYFKIIYDYGMAVRQGARALIENNVYADVKTPIATDKFDGPAGFACESGNIYSNSGSSSITQTACSFWTNTTIPYSYTLDVASTVAPTVIKDAGLCNNNANPTRTLPLDIITAIENINNYTLSKVYPNPTKTEFNINYSDIERVSIYAISGEIIELLNLSQMRFGSDYLPGVYVVKIEKSGSVQTLKVVKH